MPHIELSDEQRAYIKRAIDAALNYEQSEFLSSRTEAIDLYLGNPYENDGKIPKGRSKFISKDCAEVVDQALPQILKPFIQSELSVEFEEVRPTGKKTGELATEWVRMCLFRKNNGVELFYDWFKQALMYRLGVVKTYRVTETVMDEWNTPTFTPDELDLYLQNYPDAGYERIKGTATEQPGFESDDERAYAYKISNPREISRVRVDLVPLADFIFDNNAQYIWDCEYVGHKQRLTRSDLLEMGYKSEVIDELSFDEGEWDLEASQIRETEGGNFFRSPPEERQTTTIYELYTYLDVDGFGVASLVKVLTSEDGETILDIEKVDDNPFSTITPIKIPGKIVGKSLIDDVKDIQKSKSILHRSAIDSYHQSNNARPVISPNVKFEDVLNQSPGWPIRTLSGTPAQDVSWYAPPSIAPQALSHISYIDTVRAARTGVTGTNAGLNTESLNYQTATGLEKLTDMSVARLELIARLFAETGVKRLYRQIFDLLLNNQGDADIIEFMGQKYELAPEMFDQEYHLKINVGLGSGDKSRRVQALTLLLENQKQAIQTQGGVEGPLVTVHNIYNTTLDLAKALGLDEPYRYLSDPASPEMAQLMEQKKATDAQNADKLTPEQEIARAQIEVAKMQAEAKLQSDAAKITMEKEKIAFDMTQEKQKFEEEMRFKYEELERKMALEFRKLALQYGGNAGVIPPATRP